LSVTLFEKTLLLQVFSASTHTDDGPTCPNQLTLFD
jgi:hypothetical protein